MTAVNNIIDWTKPYFIKYTPLEDSNLYFILYSDLLSLFNGDNKLGDIIIDAEFDSNEFLDSLNRLLYIEGHKWYIINGYDYDYILYLSDQQVYINNAIKTINFAQIVSDINPDSINEIMNFLYNALYIPLHEIVKRVDKFMVDNGIKVDIEL